ncbi:hypothetical protein Trydic_g3826 [Trypoxylus dichotomus]
MHTDLYIIEALTGQGCLDKILQSIVLPYAEAVGKQFITDDNINSHQGNIMNNWFHAIGIDRIEQPVNSSDDNPPWGSFAKT